MNIKYKLSVMSALALAVLTPAFASEPGAATPESATPDRDSLVSRPMFDGFGPGPSVSLISSYTGPSHVKLRQNEFAKSDATIISLGINSRIPIDEKWFVPLGLGVENAFLERVTGAPIPERINVLRLSAGVGYRFNDKLTLSARVSPSLYNLEHVDGNDLGIAGAIAAVYRVNPDLTVVGGVAVSPDSDIVVFPMGGLVWNINQDYRLDLILPKPRLIYHFAPKMNLYAGGEIKAITFRTDDRMGQTTGLPRYNESLASYRDYRLGTGLEYEVLRRLNVGIEFGYSIIRRLEYKRIDETLKFDPSPYVRAGLRYSF